jgi:hypothetical protein
LNHGLNNFLKEIFCCQTAVKKNTTKMSSKHHPFTAEEEQKHTNDFVKMSKLIFRNSGAKHDMLKFLEHLSRVTPTDGLFLFYLYSLLRNLINTRRPNLDLVRYILSKPSLTKQLADTYTAAGQSYLDSLYQTFVTSALPGNKYMWRDWGDVYWALKKGGASFPTDSEPESISEFERMVPAKEIRSSTPGGRFEDISVFRVTPDTKLPFKTCSAQEIDQSALDYILRDPDNIVIVTPDQKTSICWTFSRIAEDLRDPSLIFHRCPKGSDSLSYLKISLPSMGQVDQAFVSLELIDRAIDKGYRIWQLIPQQFMLLRGERCEARGVYEIVEWTPSLPLPAVTMRPLQKEQVERFPAHLLRPRIAFEPAVRQRRICRTLTNQAELLFGDLACAIFPDQGSLGAVTYTTSLSTAIGKVVSLSTDSKILKIHDDKKPPIATFVIQPQITQQLISPQGDQQCKQNHPDVRILTLKTEGHVAIALWFVDKGKVEVFDASGMRSSHHLQQTMLEDFIPPRYPGPIQIDFVNDQYLQKEDTACQTWIWYYVWKRLMDGQSSCRIVHYLQSLTGKQRLTEIGNFWNNLLYHPDLLKVSSEERQQDKARREEQFKRIAPEVRAKVGQMMEATKMKKGLKQRKKMFEEIKAPLTQMFPEWTLLHEALYDLGDTLSDESNGGEDWSADQLSALEDILKALDPKDLDESLCYRLY